MYSNSSKKIKRKLSIIIRDPHEIPHRKGTPFLVYKPSLTYHYRHQLHGYLNRYFTSLVFILSQLILPLFQILQHYFTDGC